MSMYDQFKNVMTANMIDSTYADYQSAIKMYDSQFNNGETDFTFDTWLDNHISHANIDGY